jgi:peptidyl-prolyl cis-trans isomerase SurA
VIKFRIMKMEKGMYHKSGRAVLAVVILLMAGTALAQTKVVEEIVARVNADIILKSELENRRAQVRAQLAEPEPRGAGLSGAQLEQAFQEQSKGALRDLIDEALLLQQAKEMGLSADLELLKTMERLRVERKHETAESLEKEIVDAGYNLNDFKQDIRTRYLTSQVLQREVYGRVIVTNEEMRKYYDEHVKDFDRPAGLRIREISIYTENRGPEEIANQRKKAEEALAAVKKGDEFGEVAAKFSESPTAQEGGDLGFLAKGELAQPLEEPALKLEKGQTTDILTLPYGFVILKVEDKHTGGILTFDLAQREVNEVLWQQAIPSKIREYLTKLRTDGFIEVREGYVDSGAAAKTATAEAK